MALLPILEAQVWCLLVLLSFVGWGGLVLRFLPPRVESIGLTAGIGTALTIFVGGVLNLLQLITLPALLTFLGTGWAALVCAMTWRRAGGIAESAVLLAWWRQPWKLRHALFFLLILLFLFRLLSTTRVEQYLPQDDDNFYLAMPVKMMETHHLAADPYSERRVESSLGGSYFLQCLLTLALPLYHVQMMDRAIGLVMLMAVMLALMHQGGVSLATATPVLAFTILLVPFEFNLTYSVLPTALILGMALLLLRSSPTQRAECGPALLFGLLAGALCVLKSVNLPFSGLASLIAGFLLCGNAGWKGALQVWGGILLGAVAVMLPWMVAMRITSGTLLYPLLGSGDDFSSYHQFPMPFQVNPSTLVHDSLSYYLPLAVIAACQALQFPRRQSVVLFLFTMACLLSSVTTGIATGGDDNFRYCFPIVLAALIAALTDFASTWREKSLPLVVLRVVVLLALLNGLRLHLMRHQYVQMIHEIEIAFANPPLDTLQTSREYDAINAILPKGAAVLTTLQKSYLLSPLDETRLLADYPGCASPPPGWPIHGNGDALADFLLAHSIRFLAYTYRDNAQLASCQLAEANLAHRSVRTQIQFGTYLLADRQYRELRQTRRVLFDNGNVFILDLATRASSP